LEIAIRPDAVNLLESPAQGSFRHVQQFRNRVRRRGWRLELRAPGGGGHDLAHKSLKMIRDRGIRAGRSRDRLPGSRWRVLEAVGWVGTKIVHQSCAEPVLTQNSNPGFMTMKAPLSTGHPLTEYVQASESGK